MTKLGNPRVSSFRAHELAKIFVSPRPISIKKLVVPGNLKYNYFLLVFNSTKLFVVELLKYLKISECTGEGVCPIITAIFPVNKKHMFSKT